MCERGEGVVLPYLIVTWPGQVQKLRSSCKSFKIRPFVVNQRVHPTQATVEFTPRNVPNCKKGHDISLILDGN